ncbi:MAG: hypothetical protein ACTSWY_06240 [Promethearchaeota archaeon]
MVGVIDGNMNHFEKINKSEYLVLIKFNGEKPVSFGKNQLLGITNENIKIGWGGFHNGKTLTNSESIKDGTS